MTRFLLDTNVISELTKPRPSNRLLEWMREQDDEALFISSLTIAELWHGVRLKPSGKRRRELEAWFLGASGPQQLFAGRVLAFDDRAALVWGELMAERSSTGRPRSALGMMIAAIGVSQSCTIVTANERDFAGFDVLNPV